MTAPDVCRRRVAELETALSECVVSLEEFKRTFGHRNVPHWWAPEDEDALVAARRLLDPRVAK